MNSKMTGNIAYTIYGDDMQAVEVSLKPGESIRAETGTMLMMEDGIEMSTNADGGIMKGIKRMFTGESFFITTFTNTSQIDRKVHFSAPYPGKIIPLDLSELGQTVFCQKDSFLCSEKNNDIEIAFTKRFGAGLFGGEGFILQKITGQGITFVHAGGTINKISMTAGQTLRVDTGCLVAFTEGIEYDIQMVRGIKNVLFGGEGLFLTTLKGEGTVYLQTLPFARLASRIAAATMTNTDQSGSVVSNMIGGILDGGK